MKKRFLSLTLVGLSIPSLAFAAHGVASLCSGCGCPFCP